MSVDEWLRLIDILKWPVAVLVGILIFRKGLGTLISRGQRAGFGSRSVDFAEPAAIVSEQQQQKQITKPTVGESTAGEAPPPPPSPAVRAFEEPIAAAVSASAASEDVKRAWLIRGAAVARLEKAHETTYRLIMGSQIGLLLQANTGATFEVDAARAIYGEAKTKYPEIYKAFEFEAWLNWPANIGLIKIDRGASNQSKITITDLGKDFLHYVVAAGLTAGKIG
jgi:hypothetical protein